MSLRTKQLAWLVSGVLLGSTPLLAQEQRQVNLKDCIQLTLENHPRSTLAKNNVILAAEKIREQRSALLPSLSFNTNVDLNVKLPTTVIPAGAFSPTETRLQMGNKFSSGASLQADLNLFNQSSWLQVSSARIEKNIADLRLLTENEQLVYSTASAYYQVLTTLEKGKLLKENEAKYKQLLEITQLRYQQGVARKSEYDRVRVNLNNIQSEVALNENNYQLSLNQLKNAMGLDLQSPLSLADSISYDQNIEMPKLNQFNPSMLLAHRIDQQNLLQSQLTIKKAQSAYLPTLAMYGRYGANAFGADVNTAFTNWFDYSTVGVKLSVPIFAGFKRSSIMHQSRLGEQNQKLTNEINERNYALEYQNSASRLLSSYTNLQKNKNNLDLAREVFEATSLEYKEGTSDLAAMMDATTSYREAQTNYITSLLDFYTSRLAYEKARGTFADYIQKL